MSFESCIGRIGPSCSSSTRRVRKDGTADFGIELRLKKTTDYNAHCTWLNLCFSIVLVQIKLFNCNSCLIFSKFRSLISGTYSFVEKALKNIKHKILQTFDWVFFVDLSFSLFLFGSWKSFNICENLISLLKMLYYTSKLNS